MVSIILNRNLACSQKQCPVGAIALFPEVSKHLLSRKRAAAHQQPYEKCRPPRREPRWPAVPPRTINKVYYLKRNLKRNFIGQPPAFRMWFGRRTVLGARAVSSGAALRLTHQGDQGFLIEWIFRKFAPSGDREGTPPITRILSPGTARPFARMVASASFTKPSKSEGDS